MPGQGASGLRASSLWRSDGGAGKGRRASNYISLEFGFHPQLSCGSPSTELSDFRQSALSGNECECEQTRVKGDDVNANVISANQYFASTFSMQIFKFQKLSCELSFLFPPSTGVTRRACSQAKVPGTNRSSTAWVGAGSLCSHVCFQF